MQRIYLLSTTCALFTILFAASACGNEEKPAEREDGKPQVEILMKADRSTTPTLPQFSGAGREDERERMVNNQIKERGINDPDVLKAMRRVPRHEFVPARQSSYAYSDQPLPIGHGQTISQPYIVAYMTELLKLDDNDKVLEVGTGSGYQAAILGEIVDEVVTVEIIDDLAHSAADRIERLGYENITVLSGDGYFGYEEQAPYDAIIVTAAAEHVPPPLISQLKQGGIMVIPVGRVGWTQNLIFVEKRDDGRAVTRNLLPVRFVPLTRKRD